MDAVGAAWLDTNGPGPPLFGGGGGVHAVSTAGSLSMAQEAESTGGNAPGLRTRRAVWTADEVSCESAVAGATLIDATGAVRAANCKSKNGADSSCEAS